MKPLENETLEQYVARAITAEGGDLSDPALITKYSIKYKLYTEQIKEYELIIADSTDGLAGVSLVENPAIQMDFMMFSKNKKVETKFSVSDNDKQIITGPALIPEQRIYRYDEHTGEEYFVYFTAETIEKSLAAFMQSGSFANINLEHQIPIKGVHLIESWIVSDSDNDKARSLGFDVPNGTWMISFKIEDKQMWDEFKKNKTIKGFSIEGFFSSRVVSEAKTDQDKQLEEIYRILDSIDIETELASDDLYDLYKWNVMGPEPCPVCKKNDGQIHTLDYWLRNGIPRVKNGGSFKGHKTNYSTSPYATFCEADCNCELVKVY